MQRRTDLTTAIKAAGGKVSTRSLQALETADASVGQSVLWDVARQLPGWDEDTPRSILEGGPIPPNAPARTAKLQRTDEMPPPHEWSAEARRKILAMSLEDILDFARQIRTTSGDRAAILWLKEATRIKAEAPAIEAELGHFDS